MDLNHFPLGKVKALIVKVVYKLNLLNKMVIN
jgi:hypothetical protein